MEDFGLVLEGGGARGAYQIGAFEIIKERVNIIAAVGTSIGAANSALIAQGDFDKIKKIWENIRYDNVMDIDHYKLSNTLKKNIDFASIKYLGYKFKEALKSGGIDSKVARKFFSLNINEEKLRNSNIKYGLVTYCITDKKPYELFIDDIPKGKLVDFVFASCRLPIFKSEAIDGKHYIDGGVYNNCPINMIQKLGIKNIIVVRTNSIGNILKVKNKKYYNIITISPRRDLPGFLEFESQNANFMLKLGKFDALKVFDSLDGIDYYINSNDEEFYFNLLSEYDLDNLNKIYSALNIPYVKSRKIFFETVIPSILKKINVKEANSYKEVVLNLVEYVAKKEKIEVFKVYEFKELLKEVQKKIRVSKKNKIDEVIYRFVKGIKI